MEPVFDNNAALADVMRLALAFDGAHEGDPYEDAKVAAAAEPLVRAFKALPHTGRCLLGSLGAPPPSCSPTPVFVWLRS
jgi:hypothetical protein